MLYDPKWEANADTKPSLQGFIAWLEQQPADAIYDFTPCPTCAIGQYLRASGKTETDIGCRTYFDWNRHIAEPLPRTFGAALMRARTFAAA